MLYNCNKYRPKTHMSHTTVSPSPPPGDLRGLSESEGQTPTPQASDAPTAHEMRSSGGDIAVMVQLGLPGVLPAPLGVGGRRRSDRTPVVRGRYPDVCNVFEIDLGVKKTSGADPRLAELAQMGLADYWLQVADYLGFDAFLGMWRILDANRNSIPASNRSGGNSMAPTLRTYSNYLRFQKNRFVETLAAQGIEPKEIQKRVATQLCESISLVHIRRLTQKAKITR